MEEYRAKYMRAANRKSYTITFRHPVVKDEGKNYGIKVHRGLGTTDETIAMELTEEMNVLLRDDAWWNFQKRNEAYLKFNEKIVDAFYDPMNRAEHCNHKYLNKIQIPGKKEGYLSVGLVGMSGVGKTSLLRHMCGTTQERFPTTSSGRTTTCNMEIILSNSKIYEAVVTFVSRGQLEMLVQECIEEAVKYAAMSDNSKINKNILIEKLLEHENLTTRLNYVLGDYSLLPDDEENDFEYSNYEKEETCNDEFEKESDHVKPLIDQLDYYYNELVLISKQYQEKTSDIENGNIELTDDNKILQLRDEIVDDVQQRFSLLENGEKLNPKGKWFDSWYYRSDTREEFIRTVKKFSSNAKSEWGTLLTPIVESIRIRGAFKPTFSDKVPKLVIYDGEGLGQKKTISSVPLKTVDMIDRCDTIMLVDNAARPVMETTNMIILKTIIDSGHIKKLKIAFTHFDDMEGDNMRKVNEKMKHVTTALSSYLSEISKKNPHALLDTDKKDILNSCYFFSELGKTKLSGLSCTEFKRLFSTLEQLISKNPDLCKNLDFEDISVKYDAMILFHHIQLAIQNYRKKWLEIIGYPMKTYQSEHWSRIKSLTRRLGYWDDNNYNNELQPIADLTQEIREQISVFLNNPMNVIPEDADRKLRNDKINKIKSDLNRQITPFIKTIIWKDEKQLSRWQEAYSFTGKNSAYSRSVKINEIYDWGIPVLDNFSYDMNELQKQFIIEFMEIVEMVLEENGAKINKYK